MLAEIQAEDKAAKGPTGGRSGREQPLPSNVKRFRNTRFKPPEKRRG